MLGRLQDVKRGCSMWTLLQKNYKYGTLSYYKFEFNISRENNKDEDMDWNMAD